MKNTKETCNFPIDLVYLWVDGNDVAWRAKKNKYSGKVEDLSVLAEARFRSNDELKYSLRSVEKFAPWVNRVFIVTDNQCPSWLNVENPKVQIIDHSQIFPADVLPVFNSTAIECVMHKIPGLSEHFLFGNDDMMFAAPVAPGDFFDEKGVPVVRLSNRRFNRKKALRKDIHRKKLARMQEYVWREYGVLVPHAPHHNIDAYCKSIYKGCMENFGEQWRTTVCNRFRHEKDVHRSAVGYYMIATGRGTMRKVGRYNRIKGLWAVIKAFVSGKFANDSRTLPVSTKDYDAVMKRYNPLMFCVNDDERCTDDDCRRMTAFLDGLFPAKSAFEK